jgi:protein involved in polysaccharide export with SLBB domain
MLSLRLIVGSALAALCMSGQSAQPPDEAKITIEGRVVHPGSYAIGPRPTTVMTLIAQAGGLAQFAEHKAYLSRTDETGTQQTTELPLWEIINRKQPDFELMPGDVLTIPERVPASLYRDVPGRAPFPIA